MNWLFYSLLVVFLFICLVLSLLVLIQKGRGGGLASAFGGGGGNTAFGSKTGDVLTWATSVVFGIFLLLAVALNLVANKIHAETTSGIPIAPTGGYAVPGQASPTNAGAPPGASQPLETPSTDPGVAPTTAPSTQPGN